MKRYEASYFIHEGFANVFSHGFMSFAAIGITVACLVVMGTFSLVVYNANKLLGALESEYEILAFVDEDCSLSEAKRVGERLETLDNVKSVKFITREEAMTSFEARHEGDYMLQDLDPNILRDRYAIYVTDLEAVNETAEAAENVSGVAKVRVDEDIAGGFITLHNVASAVCVTLIIILFVVSVFIISNTIKLTTFDRRDEIAVMKMVGATNSFIRWPFVCEGFIFGLISALCAFWFQWLLYASVSKSIALSDTLRIIQIVDFELIWQPVALVFCMAGMLIGIGGSLMAISRFLHV